ncbi:MAG: hypothetical protein A2203_02010 [Chromatiales bacterium RIFOXYA1_FULL_46_5]|nr:MAG: hypothetical protein A2203_02010 [Chromatiales bacterium RIFOXYA1_FULL_46_5]
MTSDRAAKIKTRLREIPNREDWKTILSRVKESPWHRGENDRGWIATFDWLIKNASTPIRILERSICRMDACGNEIGNGQSEAEPNLSRL